MFAAWQQLLRTSDAINLPAVLGQVSQIHPNVGVYVVPFDPLAFKDFILEIRIGDPANRLGDHPRYDIPFEDYTITVIAVHRLQNRSGTLGPAYESN